MRPKPADWKGEYAQRVEEKFDGWRATLYVDAEGGMRLLGRKPHIDLMDGCPADIKRQLSRVPPNSIVDGELYVVDSFATEVPRALRLRSHSLRFAPFAVPFANGDDCRDKTFDYRDMLLRSWSLSVPQRFRELEKVVNIEAVSFKQRLQSLKELAKRDGLEGYVLKALHYRQWYRVKRSHTADLIIIACIPGKGKHAGRIGSFEVAAYRKGELVSVGKVGGIPDQLREQPVETLINRVIEVEYDEVGAGGRLKFARMLRFRDDKPALECDL